tara:strand:- start:56 stop:700 length:645 start_codon:yes stop_codon:yes gene_type:complete
MATVIKLKRSTTASSVPTTSDLADGEVAINVVDKKVYVNNGGSIVEVANNIGSGDTLSVGDLVVTGNTDLGNAVSDTITLYGRVDSHIVPAANDTYDLGTSSLRWRTAYLSASTLDLGGATISSDGSGTITIAAAGATLPTGSLVGTKAIGTADGTTGAPTREVPFYTNAGGLGSAATTFAFKGSGTNDIQFQQFYFGSGQQITAVQDFAQFVF